MFQEKINDVSDYGLFFLLMEVSCPSILFDVITQYYVHKYVVSIVPTNMTHSRAISTKDAGIGGTDGGYQWYPQYFAQVRIPEFILIQ